MFVTVSAAKQTYGADNFNDESGELTIGFIGGSVTEGSGSTGGGKWSSLVTNYYAKEYKNKEVTELNAGIGGTGSAYGIVRMKRDLKLDSKKEAPDIVFVEFAINDATSEKRSEGRVRNVDSLVRQLLNAPKIPAIVFVYLTKTTADLQYASPSPTLPYCREDFHQVAEHYGIHEINVDEYIWQKINEGEFIWNEIAVDGSHPNNVGYAHYADCIIESLKENKDAVLKKFDPSVGSAVANPYGDIEEFPIAEYEDNYVLSDGWEYRTPSEGKSYSRTFFDKGFNEAEDAVGQTIEFEFRGVGFGITTSRNKNNANLKWELFDKENNLVKSGTYVNYYASDLDRCFGWLVVSDLPYGKYKAVLTGEFNQKSVDDYTASDGRNGGNGKFMRIEGCCVLYPTDEQKAESQKPATETPADTTPVETKTSTVVLQVGNPNAYINSSKTFIDSTNASVVPKVENGRTLVPVRFIAESFNAEVGWNDATRIITIKYNGTETRLKLGLNEMRVGDKTINLDVPVKEENGRTLLPLRAICEEVLGKKVFWDDRGLIVISDEAIDVNVEDWLNKLK